MTCVVKGGNFMDDFFFMNRLGYKFKVGIINKTGKKNMHTIQQT